MTERQLQDAVIETARLLGWLVYHTHDSRHSAKGFPDLCMVRGQRLLFVELKRDGKHPTTEQRQWLDRLCRPAEVFVWRPADWKAGTIELELRKLVRDCRFCAPDELCSLCLDP